MKYENNGQYNISTLNIIDPKSGDKIDIIPLFIDLTLYESIFSVTMSGNVSIVDSTSLYNDLALGNGEEIEIEFVTAGSDASIKYTGTVYKSSPPTRVNEHSTGLILYFCSKELINSNRTTIKRSFNQEIHKSVQHIHNLIRHQQKPFNFTETKELVHYVGANKKPVDTISNLSRKAISVKDHSGYLYFENSREFVFKPIEELFTANPVADYKYGESGFYENTDNKESEVFNKISDYKIIEIPDILAQIEDGVYGTKAITLNLRDKKVSTHTYDNESDHKDRQSLGSFPNLRKGLVNSTNEDKIGVFYDDNAKPYQGYKHDNVNVLTNSQKFQVLISVLGDSSIACGQVITCFLPVWGSTANKGDFRDFFSGNALITEIKHTIKNKGQYTQSFKLVRDAFSEAI